MNRNIGQFLCTLCALGALLGTLYAAPRVTVKKTLWPSLKSEFSSYLIQKQKPACYRYAVPPKLKFKQPDFKRWVKRLRPCNAGSAGAINVWRLAGERLLIVVRKPGQTGGEVFAVSGATVQFGALIDSNRLWMTQIGVVRWVYSYKAGRLQRLEYRRTNGLKGALYAIDAVDYWPNSMIPRHLSRYRNGAGIKSKAWVQRTHFDKHGHRVYVQRRRVK